ncbi:MAG: hypothetical protein A2231_08715 [Candidatus Firestonebacteria bacterium RIFOXYA2_FULL_40_8]|nr:MAG: hypothetical protein A2231_08715 [Candidatus Firestonebacteria bacterium RIFOXYA2_FULL_40_8]
MNKIQILLSLFLTFTFASCGKNTNAEAQKQTQRTTDLWERALLPVAEFNENCITALKLVDGKLYIASTIKNKDSYLVKVYIYDTIKNKAQEVIGKLVTNGVDTVTEIRYDKKNNQIWLTTNGNGYLADCYDLKLNLVKCYSNVTSTSRVDSDREFLEKPDYMTEDLKSEIERLKRSSLNIVVPDDQWVIFGYFKGNAYLYSCAEKKSTLVYDNHDIYYWPSCGAFNKEKAFIGSRGGGFVIVNTSDMKIKQYKLPGKDIISALAADDKYLWLGIGAAGLYKAEIDKLWK